jgi:hypothetical protein
MQLVKFPRGRENARAIDAAPVPHPHGPGHYYTEGPAEPDWTGWKVTDEFGRAVGKVESAEHPEWLVVRDRRGRHLLAPSAGAIGGNESVFLPFEANLISSAPRLGNPDEPDEATAAAARSHYS